MKYLSQYECNKYIIILTITLGFFTVQGQLNSLFIRGTCYGDHQEGCNEEFTKKYKNMSTGADNSTADTYFILFTNVNQVNQDGDKPELLHKCGGGLPPNTKYDPCNRLVVFIQGFTVGICDVAIYREIILQILLRGKDTNVLFVDWSWGSKFDYDSGKENAKVVAKQLQFVISKILNDSRVINQDVYIIGISHGAQIAGLAANYIKIKRITALDPARPGYEKYVDESQRLDKGDADLVDVIHTGAGQCFPYLSINYPAGHFDFVVNDGTHQPSCYGVAFKQLLRGDFVYGLAALTNPPLCFHIQSLQFFKVSINPGDCQFVGVKCGSYKRFQAGECHKCGDRGQYCAVMGYDLDKILPDEYECSSDSRLYYLSTDNECPYCNNTEICLEGFSETYYSSLQNSSTS